MENRTLPYQVVGNFVLFRKLEEGSLSDLWRGVALDGAARGAAVAIHRFKGGDPAALRAAANAAREPLREVSGATIAREQATDPAAPVPLLLHEYAGGRSLRGVVERASRPAAPHPIPVDQALAIAERISASLQALHAFRAAGSRLVHGAVIPQFVWITEDGEVRLAGQHLAPGIIASLKDPAARAEIGAFFAPEVCAGGEPSVVADVYSVGAILYLTLTGKVPPAPAPGAALAKALDGATLQFDDEAIPPEIRSILERTLAADPAQRFSSYDELHQTLTRVATGGEYAPTTFNLAFYLHTLMKKEREEEAEERRREQDVDLAAIAARAKEDAKAAAASAASAAASAAALAASAPAPAPAASPFSSPAAGATPLASPLSHPERARSKAPFLAAAAVVVVAAGAGAYFMLRAGTPADPVSPSLASAAMAPPRQAAPATPPAPVLTAIADPAAAVDTAGAQTTSAVPTATTGEEARKKAFEDEVNRRLQAEVARLQQDYEKQLAAERAKTEKSAPRPTAEAQTARAVPAPPTAPTTTAAELGAADRLNQQRLEELREKAAEPAPTTALDTAAAGGAAGPESVPQAPEVPSVREGDLVELGSLDRAPSLVKSVRPDYPPVARQQKFGATIIVTALITETGDVAEVRVLRGDSRKVGFDEAAVKAVRQAKFSPAMKDGKRVRTWLAMPVNFQPR